MDDDETERAGAKNLVAQRCGAHLRRDGNATVSVPQTPIGPISLPVPPPLGPSLLGAEKAKSRFRYRVPLVLVLGALVLFAVGTFVWRLRAPQAAQYVTQPVVRRSLAQTASATGTVNAQDTISVGSQVSGTISALFVDYNSRVHRGEILLRIDPSTFQSQLDQARAASAQAIAQTDAAAQAALAARGGVSVARSNASSAGEQSAAALQNVGVAREAMQGADAVVLKTASDATVAERTLARDRALLAQGYVAQSQFDIDEGALVAARSALVSARVTARQARLQAAASLSTARASGAQNAAAARLVEQTQAQAVGSDATTRANSAGALAAKSQMEQAQLNLDRTTIVSPVDGTVIARNVSVGQTIAASFQAPTLFTIAKDLTKMEVDIAVGEPDIGMVTSGAPVQFSVLAYPNAVFSGVVAQVRENPTTISNVVTYTVTMLVDNRSGRLRPGMTATAAIRVAEVSDALVVPIQALQWHPAADPKSASATSAGATSAAPAGATAASPWGQTALGASGAVVAGATGAVYVDRDGTPRRVGVRVDLVSGAQVAVTPLGGTLAAGDAVVVSTGKATATASNGVSNPLVGRSSSGGGATRAVTH